MSTEQSQLAETRDDSRGPGPAAPPDTSRAGKHDPTASSKRVLEPIERISEVLFGLIMVLTFTCTFSVAEAGRTEIRTLLIGALGCNLAWGIIDAIMYLMGCLAEKARSLRVLHAIRAADDPQKAQGLIAQALPPVVVAALDAPTLDGLRRHLQQLPEPPAHPRLVKRDWVGAIGVLLLVVLATCPVVLPFALMQNAMRAQRVSNGIAVGLLFLTGYSFGRCTGYHPRGMGLAMVVIGGALVGITILLGG
jgi:VIT1/CCC1 family predicted Fe2+/Mn2+ transporter